MNITFFTKYGSLGASSRMRSLQFFSSLCAYQINPISSGLISNHQLTRKYDNKHYGLIHIALSYLNRAYHLVSNRSKVIWIEKELFPWMPAWAELILIGNKKYILDFDDAIFHNYDLHKYAIVRKLFGQKLDKLMARASIVTVGNTYLKNRALSAGAKRVIILPTVITMSRYEQAVAAKKTGTFRIVWIGTPSTVKYLSLIAPALIALARKRDFIFRVIGVSGVEIPGVVVECLPWTERTEVNSIAECDIGIMPLPNAPWELGKCAYKLIQYMACGLPTVSSPIGANTDVVIEGETGLFAKNDRQWIDALDRLLSDAALRMTLGANGRARVINHYTVEMQAEQMADLILELDRNS
jgi:glycosyltransferase involved in cell wall biosynthesis